MKFLNQLQYGHIPYYTKVSTPQKSKSSVARSGCGLCSVCMMIDILTDKSLDIEECVRISENCLANHQVGTDMNVLAPVIAEMFDLDYTKTSDLDQAIRHLQGGGVIIGHMGVPEGADIGLFTKGGHYITIISTDGEEFCILDPSYTPEKFEIPERTGRVNIQNAPYLYAKVSVVDSETKPNRVKYHMFARKKA